MRLLRYGGDICRTTLRYTVLPCSTIRHRTSYSIPISEHLQSMKGTKYAEVSGRNTNTSIGSRFSCFRRHLHRIQCIQEAVVIDNWITSRYGNRYTSWAWIQYRCGRANRDRAI